MLNLFGDNTRGFGRSDLATTLATTLATAKVRKANTSALAKLVGAPEGVANPLAWYQAQQNLKDPNVWNLYAYSQNQKREDEKMDWSNFVPSIMSGGVYDIVRGEQPGAGVAAVHPVMSILDPISKLFSAGSGMSYDILAGIDKAGKTDGGLWEKIAAGLDRSLDVSGAVDTGTRLTGEGIKKAAPAVTPYLQAAGTAIGTLIGMFTPITPFGGALVGNALGGKLKQGTTDTNYLKSWQDAGVVAGTYGLGKVVSPYLSSLVGGGTLGKILGGLGKSLGGKALKTIMGLAPSGSSNTSLVSTGNSTGNSISEGTGVEISSAIKALTGGTVASGVNSLFGGTKSSGLKSLEVGSKTPKYAKDALASLVSDPSELSDAASNMKIKNSGMIKQPEWLVNTADMEREEKMDYTQAIKQLMSS